MFIISKVLIEHAVSLMVCEITTIIISEIFTMNRKMVVCSLQCYFGTKRNSRKGKVLFLRKQNLQYAFKQFYSQRPGVQLLYFEC